MQLGSEREREKKQSSEYTEKKGAALMMRERERSGDGTKNSTSSTSTPTPTKKNQKKTYLVPTHRTVVPSGEVWGGAPAKKIRAAAPGEAAFVESSARNYAALAAVHALENAKSPATLAADAERRADGRERSADYDSHLGIARDPVTREIVNNPS